MYELPSFKHVSKVPPHIKALTLTSTLDESEIDICRSAESVGTLRLNVN